MTPAACGQPHHRTACDILRREPETPAATGPDRVADGAAAAVGAAPVIGEPLVVKLHPTTLTPKSDVGSGTEPRFGLMILLICQETSAVASW
jgi:hypothetical protein